MIACGKCRSSLGARVFNTYRPIFCPHCGVPMRADAFPALVKESKEFNPEDSLVFGEEAGCFYHPQRKARVHCSSCGRYLCSLCNIEFDGGHICPACLEKGRKERKIKNLENRRVMYDQVALSLAVLPLFFFYITIITAPLVIYMVIRYWKAPSSLLGQRTKVRFIIAFLLAGLELVGWTFLIIELAT